MTPGAGASVTWGFTGITPGWQAGVQGQVPGLAGAGWIRIR